MPGLLVENSGVQFLNVWLESKPAVNQRAGTEEGVFAVGGRHGNGCACNGYTLDRRLGYQRPPKETNWYCEVVVVVGVGKPCRAGEIQVFVPGQGRVLPAREVGHKAAQHLHREKAGVRVSPVSPMYANRNADESASVSLAGVPLGWERRRDGATPSGARKLVCTHPCMVMVRQVTLSCPRNFRVDLTEVYQTLLSVVTPASTLGRGKAP